MFNGSYGSEEENRLEENLDQVNVTFYIIKHNFKIITARTAVDVIDNFRIV